MSVHKGAILIQKKGVTIKWFRYWNDLNKGTGKIEITWKDEDGERQSVMKEYTSRIGKVAVIMFIEAVIKYWPKYNPQVHDIVTSSGHSHEVKKTS